MFVSLQEVEGSLVIIGYSKEDKDSKVKQDVFENLANAIKTIRKSRKKNTSVARRIIQTTIISSSTRQKCLTTQILKVVQNSQKALYKYNKF